MNKLFRVSWEAAIEAPSNHQAASSAVEILKDLVATPSSGPLFLKIEGVPSPPMASRDGGGCISLTPPGWAAVATEHLIKAFPELVPYIPQVRAMFIPLFRKAVDNALEHAYQGLLPPQPDQKKENPT